MDDRRRSARAVMPTVPDAFRDVFRRAVHRAIGTHIEPDMVGSYFDVLGGLDPYDLERAAINHARRTKFLPTPAEWHAGVLAQRRRCPKCNGRGMIVVRYYSDDPFDVAICDCDHGRHFRDDGGEAFIRQRLCLAPKNRVALLEDFEEN